MPTSRASPPSLLTRCCDSYTGYLAFSTRPSSMASVTTSTLLRRMGAAPGVGGEPSWSRPSPPGYDHASVLPRAPDAFARPQLYPPFQVGFDQQHHRADDEKRRSDEDDEDSMFWAVGMLLVIIGANILALLCEINMNSEQSLLRGLGTINREDRTIAATEATTDPLPDTDPDRESLREGADDDQDHHLYCHQPTSLEDRHRRRATCIVHLRW
jgi:hypothetical protein